MIERRFAAVWSLSRLDHAASKCNKRKPADSFRMTSSTSTPKRIVTAALATTNYRTAVKSASDVMLRERFGSPVTAAIRAT